MVDSLAYVFAFCSFLFRYSRLLKDIPCLHLYDDGILVVAELVELKNGETYNGHLVNCDTWMNIHLREVICTSKDGDRFWRMPECYIRGNTIKYLRVPDEVIDKVQEEKTRTDRKPPGVGRGRGRGMDDGGARGRGRGAPMAKMSGNRGAGRGRG
ncbi:hypothetical protein HID58_031927 [Brassica napus]|uniref:U6 snRNA-associated Sm-like protein LSm4 n=1 Tax=Brassica napus TaxID=3708 RepID=A0ABQ8BUX5_BRANA|nr:hypothetical protein HID58_031927 [Brassica napus]